MTVPLTAPWLDELNAEQRAAATTVEGPVLIVAGPGTGKTKTLTARIAYLIAAGYARPDQILALTFTKKAADEMQARVAALLHKSAVGAGLSQPQVSTFHALCNTILGGGLTFIDDAQRMRIVRALAKPAAYKRMTAREVGLLISRHKNQAEQDPVLKKLADAYDAALSEQGVADFDDLLVRTKQLLARDEAARTKLQQRYCYVLVDEFQDTNMLQYDILRLLLGHENIAAIGDPNQSIYGFRGASGGIFEQFQADYPAGAAITLHTNYRSAPAVVAVGNAVFSEGAQFQLRAHRKAADAVRAVEVLHEYAEADWVVNTIHAAIGGGDFLHAVSDGHRHAEYTLKDFAILYRNRAAATAVYKAMAASGLPYQIVGDGSPYELPAIQKLIAVLRAYAAEAQPAGDSGLRAVEVQAIRTMIGEESSPQHIALRAAQVLDLAAPEVDQFIGTLVRFATPAAAVRYIDTIAEQGFYDPAADAVTLLTIHASKGLEFPYVFLIGAEEGTLPYTAANTAEEQRLFYVAVTRARDALDVLYARRRGGERTMLSPFVHAIPATILPRIVDPHLTDDQRRAVKRAVKRSQQSLF